MLDRSEVGKRGYLTEDYRLFHLRDKERLTLDYHYHEFDKLVFQIGGRVTYHIEGRAYPLQSMDVLLVSRDLIHLPVIDPDEVYERMVLWVDRGFLSRFSAPGADLSDCFTRTARQGFHLYRPRGEERERYRALFSRVEEASSGGGFAGKLLADTCVLQLIIALNRDILSAPAEADTSAYRFDPKMEEITAYIRAHLAEDLSIDRLAGTFYLSRYYLMHRFKSVYGCSVHQYIRQKRLQRAAELLRQGTPALKAAEDAGFGDYSAFLRAFRSAYGKSPREWK